MPPDGPALSSQITAERLTSLFRPRSVALVGASDKSELVRHAATWPWPWPSPMTSNPWRSTRCWPPAPGSRR